jgi:hypothetical protein
VLQAIAGLAAGITVGPGCGIAKPSSRKPFVAYVCLRDSSKLYRVALHDGLQDLGCRDGDNLRLEYSITDFAEQPVKTGGYRPGPSRR